MLEKSRGCAPIDESDGFHQNDAIRGALESRQIEGGKDAPQRQFSALNVQKGGASLSETRVLSHSLWSPVKKVMLKRPTRRHPLPSAPPVHQRRAVLAEVRVNRQFSIPDDEIPAKAKKQKPPRIARNLPVDELELAEERLVVLYDAPPLCEIGRESCRERVSRLV